METLAFAHWDQGSEMRKHKSSAAGSSEYVFELQYIKPPFLSVISLRTLCMKIPNQ